MDLQQLETFSTLAQCNSFSATAQKLYLTQPTVSARIQSLEIELGQALFQRSTRSVKLTKAGELFLTSVVRALTILEDGVLSVKQLTNVANQTVSIGSVATIGSYDIPKYISYCQVEFPNLKVTLKTGRTRQVIEMLLDGVIDAGFIRSPFQHPDIKAVPLYEDEIVLAMRPDHHLVADQAVALSTLVNEKVILLSTTSTFGEQIANILDNARIEPRVMMEVDLVEAVKQILRTNDSVAFLPRNAVLQDLQDGTLITRPIANPEIDFRRTVLLIYHKQKPATPGLLSLFKVLTEIYSEAKIPSLT